MKHSKKSLREVALYIIKGKLISGIGGGYKSVSKNPDGTSLYINKLQLVA
jgi:hypothetical protein